VRRRIFVGAIAVAGVSLVLVVGIAPAVGKTGRRARAAKTVQLACRFSLTTMPPPGSTAVVAPAASGTQYGGLSCPESGFYGGTIADAFVVPDSGDTEGVFVKYLNTGTIRGHFDLTPDEGTFGDFQSQGWTGTISVTSGTGAYKGIASPKAGTIECDSPDSVHLTCKDHFTVSMPASTAARRR
jgi:hypothetical protein